MFSPSEPRLLHGDDVRRAPVAGKLAEICADVSLPVSRVKPRFGSGHKTVGAVEVPSREYELLVWLRRWRHRPGLPAAPSSASALVFAGPVSTFPCAVGGGAARVRRANAIAGGVPFAMLPVFSFSSGALACPFVGVSPAPGRPFRSEPHYAGFPHQCSPRSAPGELVFICISRSVFNIAMVQEAAAPVLFRFWFITICIVPGVYVFAATSDCPHPAALSSPTGMRRPQCVLLCRPLFTMYVTPAVFISSLGRSSAVSTSSPFLCPGVFVCGLASSSSGFVSCAFPR